MVKPWTFPLLTFLLCAILIVAVRGARESGFEAGVKQERDTKAEHDKIMRKIGTCDWAKIMADHIQCKRQLP